jgi:Sigma-54 interaction domain
MTGHHDSPCTPDDLAKAFEDDVRLAAMCLVPVLITAPPDDALRIVRAIAARERRGHVREILACDAAAGADVIRAIADNRMRIGTDHGTAILWVAGLEALTPRDQFALMKLLAYPSARRADEVPRIVASSSVDLRDRIREGRFDARLFYRLSVIHIVVSARPHDGDGVSCRRLPSVS